MTSQRRVYGTGSLYIDNGVYYGRWRTPAGRECEPASWARPQARHD